jgi:hypothetical protein
MATVHKMVEGLIKSTAAEKKDLQTREAELKRRFEAADKASGGGEGLPPPLPWLEKALRHDVIRQVPLRLSEVDQAKLDLLIGERAIRSKMSFMTDVVRREMDVLLRRALVNAGIDEATVARALERPDRH